MSSIVLATSSAAFEQRVRRALGGQLNGSLRRWQSEIMYMDSLAAVKELAAEGPDVVAIGPNVAVDLALEVAKAIDTERPEINVILVAETVPGIWEQALRAGVREVIAPDAGDADIKAAFDRVLEVSVRRRQNLAIEAGLTTDTGKIITVLAPKGGAGKTALTTNIAAAIAESTGERVVLLDLDLQFGDVGGALGMEPEHTIRDLINVPGGVTMTTLKVFLTRRSENLYALCAPLTPAAGEEIPDSTVDRVIRLLSEEFAYVVVDTSAGLDEAALAALELSTDVLFLTDLSVSALRGLKKVVEAVDALGLEHADRHFVLNRADSKVGIEIEEAAALVGMPVDVEIPSSRAVPLAMNRGVPVIEDSPRAPVSRSFRAVASRFYEDSSEKGRGLFRRDR
jgi:pilus assembly protein CpaE